MTTVISVIFWTIGLIAGAFTLRTFFLFSRSYFSHLPDEIEERDYQRFLKKYCRGKRTSNQELVKGVLKAQNDVYATKIDTLIADALSLEFFQAKDERWKMFTNEVEAINRKYKEMEEKEYKSSIHTWMKASLGIALGGFFVLYFGAFLHGWRPFISTLVSLIFIVFGIVINLFRPNWNFQVSPIYFVLAAIAVNTYNMYFFDWKLFVPPLFTFTLLLVTVFLDRFEKK